MAMGEKVFGVKTCDEKGGEDDNIGDKVDWKVGNVGWLLEKGMWGRLSGDSMNKRESERGEIIRFLSNLYT